MDLPIVRWGDEDQAHPGCWMGLPPNTAAAERGENHWHKPLEPLSDGCPGAWYRTPFAESLDVYLPTPTQNGMMESPLVTSAAPRLVVEAVQLYKRFKALADAQFMEVVHDG